MNGPSPDEPHPVANYPQVGFLKALIRNPQILVGDFTYYDDPEGPERFETENVLYLFPFVGDRLVIGKFCALGRGVRFVMNGANHKIDGFSTYPFFIFGHGWEAAAPEPGELPFKGDTVLGHDVWVGYDSLFMPGVNVGHGAIVASRSVVTSDVPPYAIVGGNPARLIRKRFADDVIERLIEIAWWDWPIDKITRNLKAIAGGDLEALDRAV